jgi:hypothetical protein
MGLKRKNQLRWKILQESPAKTLLPLAGRSCHIFDELPELNDDVQCAYAIERFRALRKVSHVFGIFLRKVSHL